MSFEISWSLTQAKEFASARVAQGEMKAGLNRPREPPSHTGKGGTPRLLSWLPVRETLTSCLEHSGNPFASGVLRDWTLLTS